MDLLSKSDHWLDLKSLNSQARRQKILLGGSFEGKVDLFLRQPFN